MPAPAIPSNFIVQQADAQVLLTWNIVPGATSYPIERSLDNVTFSPLASPVVNQYLDTSVTTGVSYFYRISSDNGTQSGFTNSQQVTPTKPGEMTLGQLRLLAQQKADRVNSNFVTTAEWNTYINQSYFELYDILTTVYEDYYTAIPVFFTTTGSESRYDLPNGVNTFMDENGSTITPPAFYKLLGLDLGQGTNNNAFVTLHKFNFIQRNRYVYPQITSTFMGVFNLRYRIVGNQLMFIPTPSGGQRLRMWYVPRMQSLLQDTDVVDGVSGWTEYIVVDAAIKAMQKEESDVSVLMAQKQMLLDRIQSTAMNRDAGMPDTISDARNFGNSWGGYGSPNGDGSSGGL